MKKEFVLMLIMLAGLPAFTQVLSPVPSRLQKVAASVPNPGDEPVMPLARPDFTVHSDATLEATIGATKYDRQTNRSIQERLYYYPDGKMGAAWIMGQQEPAYNDRGTGYNYFDGASWDAVPLQRLETVRTGWPCYAPRGASGEMIVAHRNATSSLVKMTRSQKGTGAWTFSEIAGPAGSSGIEWPQMITAGTDNLTVHLLAVTGTTETGGQLYQGMDGALVYYRSFDGGETWDKAGEMFPQITASEYYGINGDEYSWGTPHGDTVYFVIGGNWTDTFIMVSYDNGDNWNKIPILSNSMTLVPPNTVTEKFACSDGSLAVEMDKNGVFHVAFGRMFAKGEEDGQKYYPYVDGLVYWNSNMPMLNDSLDPDTLESHGQLLGYVYSNEAGDTVVATPSYGIGLTSYPQITIDENNHLYVMWCGLTVGYVSGDEYNYRHLYLRGSKDQGQSWGEPVDLNGSIIYIYREFVYPCMAKNTSGDALHFIYQTSDQPGSAVADEEIPAHDNTIEYRNVLKSEIIPVGIPSPAGRGGMTVSQNYPNPFTEVSRFEVNMTTSSPVSIRIANMMGQVVRILEAGVLSPGTHTFTLEAAGLAPGVYSYTVTGGEVVYTRRMVIRE